MCMFWSGKSDRQQRAYASNKSHFRAGKAALLLAGPLVLFQLLSNVDTPHNTVQATSPAAINTTMPADVTSLLQRSCGNCHSYSTHWPWYSRIAPGSWMIAEDVERARKIFNLSTLPEQQATKPVVAATLLMAACETMRLERMPPPAYRFMHSESRLTQAEVKRYCDWSRAEAKRLFQSSRKARS